MLNTAGGFRTRDDEITKDATEGLCPFITDKQRVYFENKSVRHHTPSAATSLTFSRAGTSTTDALLTASHCHKISSPLTDTASPGSHTSWALLRLFLRIVSNAPFLESIVSHNFKTTDSATKDKHCYT